MFGKKQAKVAKQGIFIGKLKHLAMKYSESSVPDEEIRQIDVTDILFAEIEDRIRFHELVNMQLLGDVTSGKSTVAIYLCSVVLGFLKQKIGMHNIVGDQVEYLRVISDPKVTNTCHVIDEWNQLGETGFNATTEGSLLQYYSDVQAQRYIHRVSCSPKTVVDPNSAVILDVLSADKEKKLTYVLVSYRLSGSQGDFVQLVGYAVLDVSSILKNPVYARYREKKFQKMDLVIREGVRDVREIHQASIILMAWDQMRPMAAYMRVPKDIVGNYIEKVRRENKEFLSILTSEELKSKAYGLLTLEYEINKASKMAAIAKTPVQQKEYEDAYNRLSEMRQVLIGNYNRLVAIGEKYANI